MMNKGKVIAVCTSPEKGTPKKDVVTAELKENFGLMHDAHAGNWHRQVSLLSYEKFCAFRDKGAPIVPGSFGENLLVDGIDFSSLPIGTHFSCGSVLLELTQIGKECHKGCAIRNVVGDCIMPREGVFARVLKGGVITAGDTLTVDAPND